MEQRPGFVMLRVRLVQGRGVGDYPERLAQALRPPRRRPHLAHRRLLYRLLCLPEYPPGRN